MPPKVIHALILIWLPALSWGLPSEPGEHWLLMVRTVNTDGAREAEFNRWYDETDVPDVLKVPGFERARRGLLLFTDPAPADSVDRAGAGGAGRYVALYDIRSPAIDKTIIDMLMATWKMISVGHDTPLLKVEERTYYGRISAFTGNALPAGPGTDKCLVLERFGARPGADIGRLLRWYDGEYRQTASRIPGVARATLYELYRVLMFEPTSAPRFMTVFEIECASPDAARLAAQQIERRHRAGAASGYWPEQTLIYRQVGEKTSAANLRN